MPNTRIGGVLRLGGTKRSKKAVEFKLMFEDRLLIETINHHLISRSRPSGSRTERDNLFLFKISRNYLFNFNFVYLACVSLFGLKKELVKNEERQ